MYRLKKSRSIFFHTLKLFGKKRKKLSESVREEIHETLTTFQTCLMNKDIEGAHNLSKKCELLTKLHMRRGPFDHIIELVFALVFALIVAVIVRSMWFEFYEIPSGSMRPTLLEQDRLVVSKTQFGINIPLSLKHVIFEPEEVKRGGIFVFTGEEMDIPDNQTRYFYLFPGFKQYIKRMMGLPGDTLYFYGGQIYGIDKEGNDITPELQPPNLSHISHVPFMTFEGKVNLPSPSLHGVSSPAILTQMGMPVAKLYVNGHRQIKHEILYKTEKGSRPVEKYGDLWGFKNYAMAQITQHGNKYTLDLIHSPNLKNASIQRDLRGYLVPTLSTSTSKIPLDDKLLQQIFDHIDTARFKVRDGQLMRLEQNNRGSTYNPKFAGIPNGTYEFLDGVGYQIQWQGIKKKLPASHPLMVFSPEMTTLLFNLGNEFDVRFLPSSKYDVHPSRFAFFKKNSLYLMGKEIIAHDDPALIEYVNREVTREHAFNGGYTPFIDIGPPLTKDGSLDIELIKEAGVRIPEGHYLGLGDNYSVSLDCRRFGFVPASNIRGVPEFIFWPIGTNFGAIAQADYPTLTVARVIIWGVAAIVFIIWAIISGRKNCLPVKIPK